MVAASNSLGLAWDQEARGGNPSLVSAMRKSWQLKYVQPLVLAMLWLGKAILRGVARVGRLGRDPRSCVAGLGCTSGAVLLRLILGWYEEQGQTTAFAVGIVVLLSLCEAGKVRVFFPLEMLL